MNREKPGHNIAVSGDAFEWLGQTLPFEVLGHLAEPLGLIDRQSRGLALRQKGER